MHAMKRRTHSGSKLTRQVRRRCILAFAALSRCRGALPGERRRRDGFLVTDFSPVPAKRPQTPPAYLFAATRQVLRVAQLFSFRVRMYLVIYFCPLSFVLITYFSPSHATLSFLYVSLLLTVVLPFSLATCLVHSALCMLCLSYPVRSRVGTNVY